MKTAESPPVDDSTIGSQETQWFKHKKRYHELFEQVPVGLFQSRPDGRILDANQAFIRMLGYPSKDSLMARNAADFYADPMDREEWKLLMEKTGVVQGIENRFRRYDKALIWVRENVRAVRDENGRVRYYEGSVEDITLRKQAEEALIKERDYFASVVDNSADAIGIVDQKGRFVRWNQRARELFGYSFAQLAGRSAFEMYASPQQRDRMLQELRHEGMVRDYEIEMKTCGGKTAPFSISISLLKDDEGRPNGSICVARDLRNLKAYQQALKQGAKRYRAIFENTGTATVIIEKDTTISLANRKFAELSEYTKAEIEGKKSWTAFVLPEDLEWMHSQHEMRRRSGEKAAKTYEFRFKTRSGRIKHVHLDIDMIPGTDQSVASLTDITEHIQTQTRLRQLIYYDDLTGLPNRTLLLDRLEKAIARADRYERLLGLFAVDIDHTKAVNDTLGYAAGDALIQEVARRLESCTRQVDTVCRMSGDKFILLAEGLTGEADARTLGERLCDAVKKNPIYLRGTQIFQDISVGYSLYPLTAADGEILQKQADIAMYQARESFDERKFRQYSPNSDEYTLQFSLLQELRRAVRESQFLIYYQPQVDIRTGRLVGMEALLRWRHPVKGIVPPSHFIPVLEESGLIRDVGAWGIQTACRQLAQWKQTCHPPPQITVNCCVHELYNPLTLENLRNALTESRIEPVWLGLEITERVAMKQMETINRILETVSQWGMPILLDDFGTGYSSLSLLQTLPVDVVKIDKSFIQSMLTDPRSAALVRTIIRMCHELGKTVMAEGIESRSQLKHLQKLGCDYGQGFLFGKPSPPAAFSKNPYRYRCMAEYGN